MIITVTMNPAIDKTVDVTCFQHGALNRITNITRDAGGKGINVSKTVLELGGTSIATGFLAGDTDSFIEKFLNDYGIRTDFVHIEGETRTNTKVVEPDGTLTELNEPGPSVTAHAMHQLIEKLEAFASQDTLVILAGSVPAGTDPTIYRTITEKMHEKGASVLLDADGALFAHALEAGPDIIKPNRFELEQYFGNASDSDSFEEIADLGKKLLTHGIRTIAISMGADGALFLNSEECLHCPGLSVRAHSTVGAGDAMVAALAYSWEQKLSLRDSAVLAMAASAGAVTTTGTKPPSTDLILKLKEQVTVEKISH